MVKTETAAIVPVHITGLTSDHLTTAYAQTHKYLSEIVEQVITVNDGSNKKLVPDAQINLDQNRGKSEAVRRAMKLIINQPNIPNFILQTDGDMDQDPRDVSIIAEFLDNLALSPNTPALVIGNRYHRPGRGITT